jgi:CheY-like chemotaxis protein
MANPRVLVVDDSDFIVEMLHVILENEAFDVISARSGREGVARALAEAPDVVLLDVRMPEFDGWDAMRALRADERTRELPVVMTSTEPEESGWTRALESGAQAYIRKPFAPAEVVDVLRDMVAASDRTRGVSSSSV